MMCWKYLNGVLFFTVFITISFILLFKIRVRSVLCAFLQFVTYFSQLIVNYIKQPGRALNSYDQSRKTSQESLCTGFGKENRSVHIPSLLYYVFNTSFYKLNVI